MTSDRTRRLPYHAAAYGDNDPVANGNNDPLTDGDGIRAPHAVGDDGAHSDRFLIARVDANAHRDANRDAYGDVDANHSANAGVDSHAHALANTDPHHYAGARAAF